MSASCLASGASPTNTKGDGGGGGDTGTATTMDTGVVGEVDRGAPPPADTGPDVPLATNGYTVRGPTIYDSTGAPHLFHGVDRPSLEWDATGQESSVNSGIPATDFTTMATSWKANVVRVSLNQDFWLSGAKLYNSGYQTTVMGVVRNAEAAGLDVILDLHWSDCGNLGVTETASSGSGVPDNAAVSGQQVMGDANSVTFWTQVATMFKADPHVLLELYNEPNGVPWTEWLSGGNSTGCATAGMQALYNAVRLAPPAGAGAENLVIIGGLNYAFDLSGVSSGLYQVAGNNIIYATHPYNEGDKQMAASGSGIGWDAAFGNLTANFPVMITEFGDTTACSSTYSSEVIAYANKTGSDVPANEISWSGYGWFVGSCTMPSLITDWAGTPTVPGQVVQSALLAY
jgi:endoglucanase